MQEGPSSSPAPALGVYAVSENTRVFQGFRHGGERAARTGAAGPGLKEKQETAAAVVRNPKVRHLMKIKHFPPKGKFLSVFASLLLLQGLPRTRQRVTL